MQSIFTREAVTEKPGALSLMSRKSQTKQKMSIYNVKFAVYGALKDGNQIQAQAIKVTSELQDLLDQSDRQGVILIGNDTLGQDPSKGNGKHFAAIVSLNGVDHYFACGENQTIDFNHSILPTQ